MLLDEELRMLLLRLALCLMFDAVVVPPPPPLLPCGFVVMPVLLLRLRFVLWRLRLLAVVAIPVALGVVCCFEVFAVVVWEEEVVAVAIAAAAATLDVVAVSSGIDAAVAAAVVGFSCKCSC